MTLDEARDLLGAGVVYRPYPGAPAEDGVITSVGPTLVFVRYRGDHGSKATAPEMLSPLVRSGRVERLHTQDCCLATVPNPAAGPRPGCPGVRDVRCGPDGADVDELGSCVIHGPYPCPAGSPTRKE